MMNIIRADIYAILRGKGIYITFGLIFAFLILTIGTQTVGGISTGGIENTGIEVAELGFDGISSAALLYTSTDNLIFFMLPLILLASAPGFSNGTVKNDIAWGISRTKLYVTKLIVAIGLCVAMMVFYISVGMTLATLLNGWGGTAPDGYWLTLFQTIGAQLFMLIGMTCIGVFLVFTAKRTAIANGAYLAFCLVPTVVLVILAEANFDVIRLMDFIVTLAISRLGFLSQLETESIINIFSAGAVYIVGTTIAGIILFKKAEIK